MKNRQKVRAQPKERFIIVRQVQLNSKVWMDACTFTSPESVPQRALERMETTSSDSREPIRQLYQPREFCIEDVLRDFTVKGEKEK